MIYEWLMKYSERGALLAARNLRQGNRRRAFYCMVESRRFRELARRLTVAEAESLMIGEEE